MSQRTLSFVLLFYLIASVAFGSPLRAAENDEIDDDVNAKRMIVFPDPIFVPNPPPPPMMSMTVTSMLQPPPMPMPLPMIMPTPIMAPPPLTISHIMGSPFF